MPNHARKRRIRPFKRLAAQNEFGFFPRFYFSEGRENSIAEARASFRRIDDAAETARKFFGWDYELHTLGHAAAVPLLLSGHNRFIHFCRAMQHYLNHLEIDIEADENDFLRYRDDFVRWYKSGRDFLLENGEKELREKKSLRIDRKYQENLYHSHIEEIKKHEYLISALEFDSDSEIDIKLSNLQLPKIFMNVEVKAEKEDDLIYIKSCYETKLKIDLTMDGGYYTDDENYDLGDLVLSDILNYLDWSEFGISYGRKFNLNIEITVDLNLGLQGSVDGSTHYRNFSGVYPEDSEILLERIAG